VKIRLRLGDLEGPQNKKEEKGREAQLADGNQIPVVKGGDFRYNR